MILSDFMRPLERQTLARRVNRRRLGLFAALPIVLFTLLSGGCTVLGSGESQSVAYYVLKDLQTDQGIHSGAARGSNPTSGPVLMLGGVTAAALYDSDRIVYTRDGMAHGYYQFAHWSERPGKRLAALAEQRLARSGRFGAVIQSVSGVKGDWLMNLRLDELTHDESVSPAIVRLRLSAELVDWQQRQLIARQTFNQEVRVPTRDAPGAAHAASEALTRLLDDMQTWAVSLSAPAPRTSIR